MSPNDNCGRCGCERRYHNPPKAYTSAKFRVGLTNTMIQVKAMTSCDSCPHCICFCIGFLEPFDGQPFPRCKNEAEDHTHIHINEPKDYSSPLARMVSPVQPRIHVTQGVGDIPSTSSIRKSLSKKTKLRNTIKPRGGKGGLF